MEIQLYSRKPLVVEAIRVSADNLEAISAWCGGTVVRVENETKKDRTYISVDVINPVKKALTRAHVGDWVLKSNKGFKIYTNNAFRNSFIQNGE